MADKPKEDAPETAAESAKKPQAKGSGMALWLPWACALLLMPAMAYGFSMFVLLPRLQKSLGVTANSSASDSTRAEGKSGESARGPEGDKQTVSLTKLVVNVAGTMGSRYLLASVTLVGSTPDFRSKVEASDAQLRDMACGLLSVKTIADLEKPGARNMIRNELLTGFNHSLGSTLVKEIYITEFAIQ